MRNEGKGGMKGREEGREGGGEEELVKLANLRNL